MTLEFLEDTLLDLGPNFWAVAVLVALVLIEVFQLGPHWFAASKKDKKGKSSSSSGTPTLKRTVPGVSEPRKRHRSKHGLINKVLFRDCVVNVHYFGERDHALLYLGPGGEELNLRPKPPDYAARALAGGTEPEVAPSPNERDNYVIAFGEDPEVTALKQLSQLWSARDHSDSKYLVLYCSRQPSTYAVQCIASELQSYTDKVGMSVLYEAGEEGEEEASVEDKMEHLKKAGITMSKID